MEIQFTSQDKKLIEESIRGKYAKASLGAEGLFSYPTGLAGLEALKYDPDFMNALPMDVAACYCGVGNPFTLGPIHEGDAVLDIGCGAGVDTLAAAMMNGSPWQFATTMIGKPCAGRWANPPWPPTPGLSTR